jgi:hypothetical protein
MSYGYNSPYNDYSHTEYALPLAKINIHPNSVAAQLVFTTETMVEMLANQERWYREEYLPELEAETKHQQEQHSNNTPPSPTPIMQYSPPPTPTTHLKPSNQVPPGPSSALTDWIACNLWQQQQLYHHVIYPCLGQV